VGERHPGKIHLVISDLSMPGIDGVKLARCFAEVRPDSKVILMSGYAEAAVHKLMPQGARFIGKPFRAPVLIRKVREILEGSEINDRASRTAQQ
jgi:DNA-binding NtrC family response regulator